MGHGYANVHGRFEFYLPYGPAVPVTVTAIATDSANNSSEFSVNAFSADITAVDDQVTGLPTIFSLDQNYPNPFNPSTNIPFSLPRAVGVRLTVFNALGRTVRTLVNQRLSPGNYVITWDGQDSRGRPVASGIYFYRLVRSDQTATRKMLLIK